MEDCMRFDQAKMENLQKLQQLQMEIKSANRLRGGSNKQKEELKEDEDPQDDVYEDYFENQMMRDMEGIEEYEQQIDYFEALKKVEEKVAELGGSQLRG